MGQNYRRKDYALGLMLAKKCEHEEAYWINSILHNVPDSKAARLVFEAQGEADSGRSLYWSIKIDTWRILEDFDMLERSAKLGYAQAQARYANRLVSVSESMTMLQSAAEKYDPAALADLGSYHRFGIGCDMNLTLCTHWYLQAARLGHVDACNTVAMQIYSLVDWERYAYWGKIANVHNAACHGLLRAISECLPPRCMYELGRAFKGHVDTDKKTVFGIKFAVSSAESKVFALVELYNHVYNKARAAVDMWLRAGLCNRDLRLLIGKRMWKARVDWL